ncbi:MAG TPA: zf-HC2 domain-containing protein [Gemmatimonadaceae bacterium]|nr:zf-HC2 domain-containing protein [Gemmatimonadaceae bacterium]
MDCREFRKQHLAFTDGTLGDDELMAMQLHLAECRSCDRYDTVVRRGLMVLRNLAPIETGPDFLDRLNARLYQLDQADARAAVYRGPGFGSFIAAATGMLAAGFLAAALLDWTGPVHEIRFAPVVAMRPAVPPAPPVDFDFVASASAGLPVWSAAMMAEQAPVHFANFEFGR